MKNREIIGIIGAMDTEVAGLISKIDFLNKKLIYGNDFYLGKIDDTDVVIAKSGIGKVNAGICTQIMIDRFEITALINSGIAGGLEPSLHIGDICIGNKMIQHDYDLTPFGHVKGYIPNGSNGSGGDKPTEFESDKRLVDIIEKASCEISDSERVLKGTIVSGDQFIADLSKKKSLHEEFGAIAAEMEGAAIAHSASHAGVPFVVIRVISDLANGDSPASFEEFEKDATNLSIAITERAISLLNS